MRFASDPRRALAHPLWWSALGVLLLNDHLLKAADVLPGAITGKASDLAGLIVAPVLAAALLRARTPSTRALAFALPTLPFVAINLSPAAAEATESLMAAAGVPWRIWTDPTDLVALAILPVAWWVADGAAAPARRRAVEGLGLGLGAFACIATSQVDPSIQADTYVVNRTGEQIDLRVRWVEGEVDCYAIAAEPARALSPDVFGDGVTMRLDAERAAPLDYRNALNATGGAGASERSERPECDAAMVEADGLPRTIVFWTGTTFQTVPAFIGGDDDLPPRGLEILPADDGRLRAQSDDLAVAPARERPAASACAGGDTATYEWSVAGLPSLGAYRLEEATTGPDGCWQLGLVDDLDESAHRAFLCVPAWAFPFRAGDRVRIELTEAAAGGYGLPSLRVTREHEDGSFGDELLVTRIDDSFRDGPATGHLEAGDCGGDRTECGAYVAPASLVLDDGTNLAPGEVADVGTDSLGRLVSIGLGRAESVLVSHPDCTPGQRQLGTWGDVVVLYEEEIE